MLKTIFDRTAALLGIFVFAPVLIIVAILVKVSSPGPVFYRGVRVGRFGRPFRQFKFRSMVVSADKIGGPSTADDDPRLTRIGKFLRKYKLDELPQLFNVLAGDMSLVGPRPEVPFYVGMFSEEEKLILSVRPGITDCATLWNPDEGAVLAGAPDPEKVFMEKIRPKKVALQLEYVRNRTFLTDIVIILKTLRAIVTRRQPPALEVLDRREPAS